jgi:hypothetical protein
MNITMIVMLLSPHNPLKGIITTCIKQAKLAAVPPLRGLGVSKFEDILISQLIA